MNVNLKSSSILLLTVQFGLISSSSVGSGFERLKKVHH